jgi:hypothetical protein
MVRPGDGGREPGRYRARVDEAIRVGWIFAVLTLVALLLAALIVIGAVVQRFRGRRPGRRWGTAALFLFAFQVGGLFLFMEGDSLGRAVTLGLVGITFVALLWRDRRVQAGALLAGTALPWTAVWGYYVFLMVTGAIETEATLTWTLFLAGAAPTAIGLVLMLAGDPLPPEPSPTAPVGQPGSRKVGIVAQTVLAPESIGPIPISELAAFLGEVAVVLVVGAAGIPFPAEAIAQIGLATLAGNSLRIVARPARARRAYEAFSWLAEWEVERAKRLTGRGAPLTKTTARRWLDQVPDEPATGWIRVEVLEWLERFDEAQSVADRMPTATPYDRFEQRFAFDSIDWMRGGDGDPDAVRAAADEIDPADEEVRLRAEVAMAIRESARIAADRGPEAAIDPLLRARDLIGERADNQLVRALWRRYLPISFATAVVTWAILGAVT